MKGTKQQLEESKGIQEETIWIRRNESHGSAANTFLEILAQTSTETYDGRIQNYRP